MEGITVRVNPVNGFTVFRVHYTADPEKRTEEWKREARRGMSPFRWQREMEIDYERRAGKVVYPEFLDTGFSYIDRDLAYLPGTAMTRGWDFGYHSPSCVFSQPDERGRWCVHAELVGRDIGIRVFGSQVQELSEELFPRASAWVDFGDPRGRDKSDKSEKTTVEILAGIGIAVACVKAPTKRRLDLLRNLLLRDAFRVHPRCLVLVEGFRGQYCYPEAREGEPESELPEKDGFYDNPQDALGYSLIGSLTGYGGGPEPGELVHRARPEGLFARITSAREKVYDPYEGYER